MGAEGGFARTLDFAGLVLARQKARPEAPSKGLSDE